MKREIIIQQQTFRNSLALIGVCMLLGILYPILSREFSDPVAFINGILIGLIGGIFIVVVEPQEFQPPKTRTNFIKRLIFKSLIYATFFSVLVPLVIAANRGLEQGIGFYAYLTGPQMRHFVLEEDYNIIVVYILILSGIIVFTRQMSRKIGPVVFRNILSGKYHRAKEEERIFMFMDVNSSTTIAEKLGELRYHEFLNDFFYDVTPGILASQGEVYRYVGDEVVVSWKMKPGLKNANCIRTYFYAQREISRQKEKYLKKYGFIPGFSAGFNSGKIMCGELGDVKSQIVFLGKVMYTTARVEKQCRKLNRSLLITSTLMDQLTIPKIYNKEVAGVLESNDRQDSLELFTLAEREIQPV